jgi:ribose transport system substrate-binding protein
MRGGDDRITRRGRWLVAAAISLSLAAAAPMAVLAQEEYTPTRAGGIPGALLPEELSLWVYDGDSGRYEVVEGDATEPYVPNLRAFPEGTTIGFAEGLAAIPFSNAINRGVYRLADELGYSVVYCDNNYDAALAITCAETIAQQAPDFVIESNWQAGAADAVMAIFDAARIPAVTIDVVHPNAIFLGADNWTSGFLAGEAAANHATAADRCGESWVLVGVNPGEGDAANERLTGFIEGVQSVCGVIPEERIDEILTDQQTSEQSLTLATDWLTAHPEAGFVLASTIDDARSDGVARALAQSGRAGVAVGIGCDDIGIAATRIPVDENHFLGCVAYFPEKYPDYAISIAADVLEGRPVPQEVHLEHVFLGSDTIDTVYPAE